MLDLLGWAVVLCFMGFALLYMSQSIVYWFVEQNITSHIVAMIIVIAISLLILLFLIWWSKQNCGSVVAPWCQLFAGIAGLITSIFIHIYDMQHIIYHTDYNYVFVDMLVFVILIVIGIIGIHKSPKY
jgi:hypothetical protein